MLTGTLLFALHLPIAAQIGPAVPEDPTHPVVEPGDEASQRETAELLLSGYHGIPEAEVFERALVDPHATLLEIATDPQASPIHRDRALAALANWPSEQVRSLYEGLLVNADTTDMVRHRVIGHLAIGYGDDALDTVAAYLDSDDVQFRLTAVQALGEIGTPAAIARLEQASQVEASEMVRQEMLQRVQTR